MVDRGKRDVRGGLFLVLVLGISISSVQAQGLFSRLTNRYTTGDPEVLNQIGAEGPKGVTAGDMNGDGFDDIVVANLDGSVSVLLSTGVGSMEEQRLVPSAAVGGDTLGSLRAVAVADFNSDGKLDVAAADILGERVVILLGGGDGTLVRHSHVPVGPARTLAVGDFDQNGSVDLAVGASPSDCEQLDYCLDPDEADPHFCQFINVSPPNLSILFGNDDGTFGAPQHLLENYDGCIYDVQAVDLNHDGYLDVLALDYTHRDLLIFPGDGQGGFAPATELEVSGMGPRSFVIQYLDENLEGGLPPLGATLDIAVANRESSTLDLFFGSGGFGFSEPRTIDAGNAPRDVAAGDLNGDGLAELLTTNRNEGAVSVFQGLGGGAFQPASIRFHTGTSPREIVLADFTSDGALDAAVNNRISQDISVFIGKPGLPGFLVPERFYESGISPVDVVAADFDGDGHPDVASVGLRSHTVNVRLNSGDGGLSSQVIYDVLFAPTSLAAADLNGDGDQDLAVASLGAVGSDSQPSGISTLLGRGDGTFEDPLLMPVSALSLQLSSIRVADISGDGAFDIVAGGNSGQLYVYRGLGDGTFEDGRLLPSRMSGRPLNTSVADFNNDGRLDIATSDADVLFNDGEFFTEFGAWSGQQKYFASGVPNVDKTWFVDSADLDSDGNQDLMLALTFVRPDPIGVFFGDGAGEFAFPDIYDGPDFGVVASIAEDMDGDGKTDIVIGNRCAATVIILSGTQGRAFQRTETVPAFSVEGLAVTDMNDDGRPDLVGVGKGLWVLLNGEEPQLVEPTEAIAPEHLPTEGVYINELMALNESYYVDDQQQTPDWVEFFNYSETSRDLTGWKLLHHDRSGAQVEWVLPAYQLGPMEHGIVYLGAGIVPAGPTPGLVCNAFALHRGGEFLSLADADGLIQDRVGFPELPADVSYGRIRDASRFFDYNDRPSMGARNVQPGNIDPSIEPRNPIVLDGTRVSISGAAFDELGIAYASVSYRLGDDPTFHEIALFDNGLEGDRDAGDLRYGAVIPNVEPGTEVTYYLRVVDRDGEEVTVPGDVTRPEDLLRFEFGGSQSGGLQLSEVVADNETGLADELGEREDWVELVNCGAEPVALDGLALTKDFFTPEASWPFPSGTTLAPGERLIVFCDNDERQGPLHASFRLNRAGDELLLLDLSSSPPAILDALAFGPQDDDAAFGRPDCGDEPQALPAPTPGAPNTTEPGGYRRGDVDGDGGFSLTDSIFLFSFLFLGGSEPPCHSAADADDSGLLDLTDGIYALNFLFLGGAPMIAPFPDCGDDPTADGLTCESYATCRG